MYTIELPVGWFGCKTFRLYYNGKLIGLLYQSKKEADKLVKILNTHPSTD